MSETIKQYKIEQLLNADGDMLVLHPETDSDIVKFDNKTSGLTSTDVKSAIDEIDGRVDALEDWESKKTGLVTGVKGNSESSYRQGQVNITQANIGLGNVTNVATESTITKDSTKNITSGAVYSGLALKVDASLLGANSGVATLDSDGKVPSTQLPSYVDDVLEYASKSNFPTTGESGKIYVALDTNLTYRWSGSTYIEISQSLALGETSSTAYAGDKGKAVTEALATHKADTSNPHSVTKSQVGLGNVENTALSTWAGSSYLTTTKVGTLAGAAIKGVDTSISASTTSTNLPTSKAVEDRINAHSGIDKTGTVTSVTITNGTGISVSSTDAITTSGSRTISLSTSGVTSGTYSAVAVDVYGRATAGGSSIEVDSGTHSPSTSLVVGGLFFAEV